MSLPQDPFAPVQIGAREIYDELKTVGAKVDRVDGKVDGLVGEVSDHEARLRALERGRWPLPSLAALLALGSLIVAITALIIRGG